MTQKVNVVATDIMPKKSLGTIWVDLQSAPEGGVLKSIKNGEWNEIGSNSTLKDPYLIDMKYGEYLYDIVLDIIDNGDVSKLYTINFYSYSLVIDMQRFLAMTSKLNWPKNIMLNISGEVCWWPESYYGPGSAVQTLFSEYQIGYEKLFNVFKFDRYNVNDKKKAFCISKNMSSMFINGLDASNSIANNYSDIISNPNSYGNTTAGLVYCKGDESIPENRKLYKKVGGVFYDFSNHIYNCDLTGRNMIGVYMGCTEFKGCGFSHSQMNKIDLSLSIFSDSCKLDCCNLSYADFNNSIHYYSYFSDSNMISCKFDYSKFEYCSFSRSILSESYFGGSNLSNTVFYKANAYKCNFNNCSFLSNVSFYGTDLSYSNFTSCNLTGIKVDNYTNFKHVSLSGSTNLPADINTKAKFISVVGSNNVDSMTMWIDGSSILS